MERILVLISISFVYFDSPGQIVKDSIFLYEDYMIMDGTKYNRMINDMKEGMWIEYKLMDKEKEFVGLWHGEKKYGWHQTDSVYRALKHGEYEGVEIIVRNDSTIKDDGWKSFTYVSKIITNIIPHNLYWIESIGQYQNNERKGKWIFFDESNEITKQIEY